MSPQASLEAQSKCGSFLQESNWATFLNQHIESRFIYTSIFFVCMMFTGIPDFSLWLCHQGSTRAQDNRTSLGMFCRGLTQICSQESSPQKIVVNTPSDAKPLIVAINSWRFWIILSRKYLETVRLQYTLGESHWMQRSQKKLTLSNMSADKDCSCDSLKIWALIVADISTILLHVFESKDEIHFGRSCGISLKKSDYKEKYHEK